MKYERYRIFSQLPTRDQEIEPRTELERASLLWRDQDPDRDAR